MDRFTAAHAGKTLRSRLLVGVGAVVFGLVVSAAEPGSDRSAVNQVVLDAPSARTEAWRSIPIGSELKGRALDCVSRDIQPIDPDDVLRVWRGLADARCDRPQQAMSALSAATPDLGDLDHWRFVVWAESAFSFGVDPNLPDTLTSRPSWVRDELELPYARYLAEHNTERFWRLYQPRLNDPSTAAETELDELAWSLAKVDGDPRRARIAVRLLVHSPVQASVLKVVEVLRSEDGSIPWTQLLGTELLLTRAENLIDADIPKGALATLEEVPSDARSIDWKLLRAEALTLNRQGAEAWALLTGIDPGTETEIAVAWARAEAALDAAQVRRGRENLSSSERALMRARGHQQLDWIAGRSDDPDEQARALRRRVADLNDDDPEEEVTALVAALVELDPQDRSGEQWLWSRGWRQYQARNWTGAVGWWRRLLDIYPRGREAERARYWSGKAHLNLGDRDRAEELWRQIADSPVDHYYALRARERLPEPVVGNGQRFAATPRPEEPRLALASWFADAGLPEMASRELERLSSGSPTTGEHILRARIDTDLGNPREGIVHIWRAYQELGTPHEVTAPRFAHELYYPRAFEEEVLRHAELTRLEPELVWAIIRQESAFDPTARSRSGARGLMQLMPATGREQAGKLGMRYSLASLADPDYNLRLGTTYFRRVLDMFDGNLELALAGYNSGPFRMRRMVTAAGSGLQLDEFIEQLPWAETKTYVRRIVQFKDSFKHLYSNIDRAS